MKKINLRNAVKVMIIAAVGATVQILVKAPFILSGNNVPYNVELVSAMVYMGVVISCLLGALVGKIVHRYQHA